MISKKAYILKCEGRLENFYQNIMYQEYILWALFFIKYVDLLKIEFRGT